MELVRGHGTTGDSHWELYQVSHNHVVIDRLIENQNRTIENYSILVLGILRCLDIKEGVCLLFLKFNLILYRVFFWIIPSESPFTCNALRMLIAFWIPHISTLIVCALRISIYSPAELFSSLSFPCWYVLAVSLCMLAITTLFESLLRNRQWWNSQSPGSWNTCNLIGPSRETNLSLSEGSSSQKWGFR